MRRFAGKIVITAGLLAIIAGAAFALPPSRQGPVDPRTGRYRSTGQKAPLFPRELLLPRLSPQGGKYPYSPKALATSRAGVRPLAINTAPGSTVRPLVVLVDFSDKPADRIAHPPSAYDLLFFDNVATALSVANYWKEVSYGDLLVGGTVADIAGWVRPGVDFVSAITYTGVNRITDTTTGVNLTNMRQLVTQIVSYLNLTQPANFFRPYADPATGEVQSLIIVHAGTGQEDTGDDNDLYSHHASVGPITVANSTTTGGTSIQVQDYVAVPEILSFDPQTGAPTPTLITPGVIVHEMGHLLGLPDLYPTSGSAGQTGTFSGVGVFDLMGYGLWGSNLLDRPDNPAHLSAWSKAFLGWLTPTLRTETTGLTLQPVEEFPPQADKVYSNTDQDPGQYFLVENRQVVGDWLFDKFLPGAGLLVWQIDDNVILSQPGGVNVDNAFRGVYVKEADGVYHMALPIPAGGTLTDNATYYGLESDYFNGNLLNGQPRVFSRDFPSPQVNSRPIGPPSPYHGVNFGSVVTMSNFLLQGNGGIAYDLNFDAWKTFNDNSTKIYPNPMRSNDILSLGFDSGNSTWMGSRGQGIFRFLGSDFAILNTLQGLPGPGPGAPAGATVARIQAMAFEAATGSMWVGTDRGLYKMRDSGSGYRVQSSFTGATPPPSTLAPPLENVHGVAVQRGTDAKYLATSGGLVLVTDGLTDGGADDGAGLLGPGFNATSIAIDENEVDSNTVNPRNDILWVGSSQGVLFRSDGQLPVNPNDLFPLPLISYTLVGNPKITSLVVDKNGILWIGTDGGGIQAFDLRDNLTPSEPNLRDPYDFDRDGDLATEAYLDFNTTADVDGVFGSNNVTGISFQASKKEDKPIAWISQKSDNLYPGGASRFDTNLADNVATSNRDERLKIYSPIPPLNWPTLFGRSSSVSAVAGDAAGNVWFATTQPAISSFPFDQANGVVRFGQAAIPQLDKTTYLNTTAVATVTLQSDGLNLSPGAVDTADVQVTSDPDATGFSLTLVETGPNTGAFVGTFGFTTGTTDPVSHLIKVEIKKKVYVDTIPKGLKPADAVWSSEYPFSDSLFIDNFSCFIATAAYGSAMAPEVVSFRAFRDRYLMGTAAGEAFVDLYYLAGPAAAAAIARSPALRAVARFALVPAAGFSSFAVSTSPAEKGTVLLLLLLAAGGLTARRGSRRGRGR